MPRASASRAPADEDSPAPTRARRSRGKPEHNDDLSSENAALVRGKPVGAVANAMDILQQLASTGRSLGATEIARALRMNRSTCFNILRTLASRDLVRFDDKTKTYGIGLGLVELARSALDPTSEIDSIRHLMERVAADFQIIVTVWRRAGQNRIVLLARADSDAPVRLHLALGQRLPLLSGSMGRILASYANLGEAEMRAQLAQVRAHMPMTVDRLIAEAAKSKQRGWSIDEGEFLQGITNISVPLLDSQGRLRFICCATILKGHLEKPEINRLAERMMEIAKAFLEHPTNA